MKKHAGVYPAKGARDTTFWIRYRDAAGRQVNEKVGAASEGMTARKAAEARMARLVEVKQRGLKRSEPTAFDAFAAEWVATYPTRKGLKDSTAEDYESIIARHLRPEFGSTRLGVIDTQRVERYVARKQRDGFAPNTIHRHLNVLGLIFKSAVRQSLVQANPVSDAERPKVPDWQPRILTAAEIGATARAFTELAEDATGDEREWIEQARTVFVVAVGAWLRRGEVLGLRWRDVDLIDGVLHVRQTVTRGREETPKSRAGRRPFPLDPKLADELWQHRRRTRFQGDDERVFCHPQTGGVLDHKRYTKTLRLALTRARVENPESIRPFHDAGRHSGVTNAAAAGVPPMALKTLAGHADFSTTQRYIHVAGELFRDDAALAGARLWGSVTENCYGKDAEPVAAVTESRD
ncbi:MAG TPA: tyrosine-type recombinase/integrase [Gaiellaceae bacterium]|jgi:integrase